MPFDDISKSLVDAVIDVVSMREAKISDLDAELQKQAQSMLKKVKKDQKLVLNAKSGKLEIVSDKEAKKDFLAIIGEACDHPKEESCEECECEEDHIPGQEEGEEVFYKQKDIKESKKLRKGQVVTVELQREIMVGAVVQHVTPSGFVAFNYKGKEYVSKISDVKIMPMKSEDIKALGIVEALDKHLANDIYLTARSDGGFYKRNLEPVWKNIERKIKSGKFDITKTKPFAKRLGKAAVDLYKKEVGDDSIVYSKETQAMVGDELLDDAIRTAKENQGIYEAKVGDKVKVDSGLGGSFTVKLTKKLNSGEFDFDGVVDMKGSSFHGQKRKVKLKDIKEFFEENDMSEDKVNEVTTTDLAQDELDNNPNSIDASPEPNSAVGFRREEEAAKQVDVLFDADYRDIASGSSSIGYRLMIQYPSGKSEFLPPAGLPPAKEIEDLRILCEILPERTRDLCLTALAHATVRPSDLPQYSGNGENEQ